MLRTNTKKARANIRAYIVANTDGKNYGVESLDTFERCKEFICNTFESEMKWNIARKGKYGAFDDWCRGLPSALDTCYFYNRSAKDDIGSILEETDGEKARYTEAQAEEMLTRLIFRELY